MKKIIFAIEQGEILGELQKIVKTKVTAQTALDALAKTAAKKDLSIAESSLLAFLHNTNENLSVFEEVSLTNLDKNPYLVMDLLKYYQQQNKKQETIETAQRVLKNLSLKDDSGSSSWSSDQGLEIEIRKFLKTVFEPKADYSEMIDNLEKLFLITTSLPDYRELAKAYRTKAEKETFWSRMKKKLLKRWDVEPVFRVFRFENQKDEILELIRTRQDQNCFPEMIASAKDKFPEECFVNYKKKIKKMLEEAKVKIYPQVAYHLRHMQRIGLSPQFNEFVNWIKTTYYRRRRLLEELLKSGF